MVKPIPTPYNSQKNRDLIVGSNVSNLMEYNNYKDGDGGGGNMNNDYVTHPELKVSESKTQAELEKLNTKIDAKFEVINHRLDNLEKNIPMIIENALLKEREYQTNQQKENRRFFWGTIIIGGISAIAGVVSILVSLL